MIERTTDRRLVESVFLHPAVKPMMFDYDERELNMSDRLIYLADYLEEHADGAVGRGKLVGIVCFLPVTNVAWNPHIALLPEHQGCGLGHLTMRHAIEWMFRSTPCEKLIAYPPVFKLAMIRVFYKCGFAQEGLQARAIRWYGELHDRMVMGLEKPGAELVAAYSENKKSALNF